MRYLVTWFDKSTGGTPVIDEVVIDEHPLLWRLKCNRQSFERGEPDDVRLLAWWPIEDEKLADKLAEYLN